MNLSRQAHAEDHCKGHFWESRFKSQAMKTQASLLACMAYVDLNPIQAGIESTPETSRYTSLHQRLNRDVDEALAKTIATLLADSKANLQMKPLIGFAASSGLNTTNCYLPFSFADYLKLVDWTGRQVRLGKRGRIDPGLPSILDRLPLEHGRWLSSSLHFEDNYIKLRLGQSS